MTRYWETLRFSAYAMTCLGLVVGVMANQFDWETTRSIASTAAAMGLIQIRPAHRGLSEARELEELTRNR